MDIDFNNYNFIIFIFLFLWITSGIFAFILSIICLFYYGSTFNKILGLFISSIFFGPFYWIFFVNTNNYCNNKPYYKIIN